MRPQINTRKVGGEGYPPLPPTQPSAHTYQPMRTLQTSADQFLVEQKNIYKQLKSDALDKMAKQQYQPAVFARALKYRNERSYLKKLENSYKQIGLLEDTDQLRYFGLGVYFYIEFFRRLCWLYFIITLIQGVTIYINYKGIGLDNYSLSFSSYFIKTTLGNYSGSVLTSGYDGLIVGLAPAASYLAIFLFYLIWKIHFFRSISVQQQDRKDVKPQKFCLQIVGLPQKYIHEQDLVRFFSTFGPVYQVSVVRNFEDNLSYFYDLDELQEQIKEEELQLMMGGDDSNRKQIAKKKQQKAKLQRQLDQKHIKPTTMSAFVHFQFQKSKVQCLSYFNQHYHFDTCNHSCYRNCCCCCLDKDGEKLIFHDKHLYISNDKPPAPQDINCCFGFFLRGFLALAIIILFLALSCAIVGICGIYISAHSNNCDSINTSSYTASSATATGDSTILRCYCNANLVSSFTDSSISTACSSYLRDIYIQQSIQYVIIMTQAITNVIFGLIVDKLVNCMRPSSKASGLYLKTAILTIFLIFNSIAIPVLIYADIFGFQPTSYVSFITIISTDIANFLSVTSLSFYPSFTTVWYRNVSPIFTNYIIFNTIAVWVSYIFYRCCCISKDSLQQQQRKILQKTMNKKITQYKLDVYKQASNLYLIIFMSMLLMSGIPAILPIAMINIVSRYLTNRSLLQGHSSKIDGLGQQFSSLTLLLLPVILIFSPLIGQWMLVSNSAIYPSGLAVSFTFLNFLKGYFTQLDKQLYLPFYLIISAMTLAQFIIYHSIIKFCSCLCSMCYQKKQIKYHSRPFAQYTKNLNILCSYNIRNNDSFRNAILHLEKYLIKKE